MKSRKAPKKKKPRKNHKAYKTPTWFNAIPYGSHGSTPAQKRLWWVISQTYRKDDWEQYDQRCGSCGKQLDHWQDGDLAHFKKYSVCNGWFKFERKNLALSCKGCNRLDDGVVGHAFGEELKRRYGANHIKWIEEENLKHRGKKIETWEVVDIVAKLRPDLVY